MPETIASLGNRRHSPRPPSVVRIFAKAAGVTPAHGKQLLQESGNNNLWDRVEKFIVSCRAAGNEALLDRRMRRILELYFDAPVHPFTPALLHEAAEADAAEDIARTDWQAGTVSRDAYLQKLDRQIARACVLREAVAARRSQ